MKDIHDEYYSILRRIVPDFMLKTVIKYQNFSLVPSNSAFSNSEATIFRNLWWSEVIVMKVYEWWNVLWISWKQVLHLLEKLRWVACNKKNCKKKILENILKPLCNTLKLPWNTVNTLSEHPLNTLETPSKLSQNTLYSLKQPWNTLDGFLNTLENFLKHPRNFLWIYLDMSLKLLWNTLETSLKHL